MPGAWTHLALSWQDGVWHYFINGKEIAPDGAFSVHTDAWINGKQVNDIFTGSTPDTLALNGEMPHLAETGYLLLDDFRIYRRPLTLPELITGTALRQAENADRAACPGCRGLRQRRAGPGVRERDAAARDYGKVATLKASVLAKARRAYWAA